MNKREVKASTTPTIIAFILVFILYSRFLLVKADEWGTGSATGRNWPSTPSWTGQHGDSWSGSDNPPQPQPQPQPPVDNQHGEGDDNNDGGDDNDDDEDRDCWSDDCKPRNVAIQIDHDRVFIISTSRTNTTRNRFEINIAANERLEISISSYKLAVSSDDFSYNATEFKLRVNSLNEFVHRGNGSGYDPRRDLTGNVWSFDESDFRFSELNDTQSNGVTVKNFQGVSGDGVFMLVGHISGGQFSYGSNTVRPISFKFDVIINGNAFGYTLNHSCLAVVASVQSETATATFLLNANGTHEDDGGEFAETIQLGTNASPVGFFTWSRTVTVNDGTSANIITSPLYHDDRDDDDEEDDQVTKRVTFAVDYQQPSKIEWDPVLGVGSAKPSSASSNAPSNSGSMGNAAARSHSMEYAPLLAAVILLAFELL